MSDTMPDSSDRMEGKPDSISEIKLKQAYKLLAEAMASSTFHDLPAAKRDKIAAAFTLLREIM